MNRKILGVAPYLVVEDVKRAAEWYRDHLGFDFVQLWGEPQCFTMVKRDGVVLMLKSVPGKAGFVGPITRLMRMLAGTPISGSPALTPCMRNSRLGAS